MSKTSPVVARYWQAEGKNLRCQLCPNYCLIGEGKTGRCLGRRNIAGRLIAENYAAAVSVAVDPIEKKPLYHFLPGTQILSVATYGCNLLCQFCQNAEISQRIAPTRPLPPTELLAVARRHQTPSVAFTYTEPLCWFEYLLDACRLLRAEGIKTVLVTNGMINPEPLAELLPLVNAMNIDLKSIRPEFYRDYVKGDLAAVLATIKASHRRCHVELTNLLIPGRNDSTADISALVDFVASLDRRTVLHFSRYFPRHRATEPPTPASTLEQAAAIARKKLDYVYLGNVVASPRDRDSYCPHCGNWLVDRSAYSGLIVGINLPRPHQPARCARCGQPADFVLS